MPQDFASRLRSTAPPLAGVRSTCCPWVSVLGLLGLIVMTGCGSGTSVLAPAAASGAPAVQPSAVAAGLELGYLWSTPEHTLRPILGVPGSSQLGAVLAPAGSYLAAAASSASSSALIEQANGALVAIHLPDGVSLPIASGMVGDVHLRFAPQGLYAIAFVPGSSSISLISGLPDAPKLATLPVAMSGLVDAVVGDSGQVVLATTTGPAISIALLNASGHISTLATLTRRGGLAMVPGKDALVAVDGSTGSTVLASNLSSTLLVQPILSTGVHGAVGVGVSTDGHWAVVANSGDQSLIRLDLTGGAPLKIPCGFQPNQVSPLLGNAVFRVTDLAPSTAASPATAGPVWIVDASPVTPQTLFIPGVQLAPTIAQSASSTATAPTGSSKGAER